MMLAVVTEVVVRANRVEYTCSSQARCLHGEAP